MKRAKSDVRRMARHLAMLGAKSALAVRAGGLVLATGLLAAMITPSTALPAGGTSPLASYKHAAPDTAPDEDQSLASGYGSTFSADPPAEPYLGPDRPYERPVSYLADDDNRSTVSDEADGFSKHIKRRRLRTSASTTDNGSAEMLADRQGSAGPQSTPGADDLASTPQVKDANGPSGVGSAVGRQPPQPISYPKPSILHP